MGRIKLQKSVNLNYSVTVSEYYLLRPESSGKGYLEELDSDIKNATNLSDWQISPPLAGIGSTNIYRTNWLAVQRTKSAFDVWSKEHFANEKIVNNRK